MQKKLSIIITGRNDNYLLNFLEQTSYVLDSTLSSIFKLNLDKLIDIIFIDWGSERQLHQNLYINNKFKKNIKFYYVPQSITNNELDSERRINTSKAHNLGIRLSASEYSLLSHSDQIYPDYVFINIISLINEKIITKEVLKKSFFYIPRKYLDKNYFEKYPSKYMSDRFFLNLNFSLLKWKNTNYIMGGGYGALLGYTKNLISTEGLNENYYISKEKGNISPDIDFAQKISNNFNYINASNYGIHTFRFHSSIYENRVKFLVKRLLPFNRNIIPNENFGLKKNLNEIKNKSLDTNKIKKNFFFKKKLKNNYINDLRTIVLRDIFPENLYKQFLLYFFFKIIKNMSILCYFELGNFKDKISYSIGRIFYGLEFIKFFDEKVNINNICLNNILYYFNQYRIGYTKISTYINSSEVNSILNFIPKEDNAIFLRLKIDYENFKFVQRLINRHYNFFSIIVIEDSPVFKISYKKFIKLNIDKNKFLLINKKIYTQEIESYLKPYLKASLLTKIFHYSFIVLLYLIKVLKNKIK